MKLAMMLRCPGTCSMHNCRSWLKSKSTAYLSKGLYYGRQRSDENIATVLSLSVKTQFGSEGAWTQLGVARPKPHTNTHKEVFALLLESLQGQSSEGLRRGMRCSTPDTKSPFQSTKHHNRGWCRPWTGTKRLSKEDEHRRIVQDVRQPMRDRNEHHC